MARTEVMLIGALPAQAGFPGAGGPIPPSVRYPYPQPDFRMNRHMPIPTSWIEPQNLLRIGDKTNYDPHMRASMGAPVAPPLAGIFSPLLFGKSRRRHLGAAEGAGGAGGTDTVTQESALQPVRTYTSGNEQSASELYMTADAWKSAWAFSAFSYGLLGAMMAGYHGSKRNGGSVGWTIGWGLLGGLFPLVTNGIALAQGYGVRHK